MSSATNAECWHLTCRAPWEKRAMLIAKDQYRTRLRVHACRFSTQKADSMLATLRAEFPTFTFKKIRATKQDT